MPQCTSECLQKQYTELEEFIDALPDTKGALIDVLHKAQGIFGYLPEEVQAFVAGKLKIPESKVYGVVRFYSFFSMEPKGEHHISVCMGTACYIKGSEAVLDEFRKILGINVGELTADGKFSIDTLRCLGACGLAPIVMVGDKTYGKVTAKDVMKIIDEHSD